MFIAFVKIELTHVLVIYDTSNMYYKKKII